MDFAPDGGSPRRPLRAERRSFDCLGAQVQAVDPQGVLRCPSGGSVLQAQHLPAPLRFLTMTVGGDDGDVVFGATVTVAVPPPPAPPPPPAQGPRLGRFVVPAALAAAALPLAPVVAVAAAGAVEAALPVAVAGVAAARAARDRYAAAAVKALIAAREAPQAPDTLVVEAYGHTWTVAVERVADGEYVLWSRIPGTEARAAHVESFVSAVLWCAARIASGAEPSADHYAGAEVVVARPASPAASGQVTLDDIGGLPAVVQSLRDIVLSFDQAEVLARWGISAPRGILLYGPPGTGKTMLTRALATELHADYVDVRVTDIMTMWMGESETKLTAKFDELRAATRRTVAVFDEFDTIIAFTGGPASGAADQMLNAVAGVFKKELPRLLDEAPDVVVVLTTNYRDRIDGSLIRKGRIDRHLEVPRPDEDARADIFHRKLTRLIERHERPGFVLVADDVDVDECAHRTPGLTGADIEECVRRAQHRQAMAEARGQGHHPIAQADLLAAAEEVVREARD